MVAVNVDVLGVKAFLCKILFVCFTSSIQYYYIGGFHTLAVIVFSEYRM